MAEKSPACKALVTGATGFIGQALINRLVATDIVGVRALRTSSKLAPPNRWTDVLIGNIDGETDWDEAFDAVDVVVHLAARVHVTEEEEPDPLAAFRRVNADGTIRLARQAAEAGVKRLVYLSSIKVLGDVTDGRGPFTQTDSFDPRDAYAISKVQAELALREISTETGLEVVILRPPLVYGPGVKGNFRTLLDWVDRGLPLPLRAVRNQRSLLGLENLIDLISICLEHPDAAGQVFHAGDREDVSTPELLRRVGAALGKPARLFPVPEPFLYASAGVLGRKDQIQRLCGSLQVDSGKAREMIGWMPRVSMEEELARTVRDPSLRSG
ncbi:MAG: SDR family oxidoreductase [Pseudomonadales bacterium]|nr:SDR family oxidoreductase [Pseudomonadales bacterium]